jgi:hypothetical protein
MPTRGASASSGWTSLFGEDNETRLITTKIRSETQLHLFSSQKLRWPSEGYFFGMAQTHSLIRPLTTASTVCHISRARHYDR